MVKTLPKSQIIDEMLEAVTAAARYIQKNDSSSYELKEGVFQGQLHGEFLYEFNISYFDAETESAETSLKFKGKTHQVKIFSVDPVKGSISLAVREHLGNHLPKAEMIVSTAHYLEKMAERLTEVKVGNIKLSDLSTKILHPSTARIGYRELTIEKRKLNKYAEAAARHALGSEVSFVWGPPGTGKTTLLSSIIQQLMQDEQSILLLSHTNVATDRVLNSYMTNTGFNPSLPEHTGIILRLGKNPSEEIKDLIEHLGMDQVIEKKQLPILQELARIKEGILQINRQSSEVDAQLAVYRKIKNYTEQLTQAKQKATEYRSRYAALTEEASTLGHQITQLESKISSYRRSSLIKKILSGTSLDRLMSKKATLAERKRDIDSELNTIVVYAYRVDEEVAALEHALQASVFPLFSEEELRSQLAVNESKIGQYQVEIEALNKELEEIESCAIFDAKMIVSTLSYTYMSKNPHRRSYDCVIVDEVSMANIPALYFAAGLAKKRVVLVGDFCQLPPIVDYEVRDNDRRNEHTKQREKELVKKWLRQDIFSFSGTERIIRKGAQAQWLKQLKLQYRMHPVIADAVNEMTYAQFGSMYTLESGENTQKKGIEFINQDPVPGERIVILNTEKSSSEYSRSPQGSYSNFYSAIVSISVAEKALRSGYKTIGIISPFRDQSLLLQKLITDKGWGSEVSAATVHKFQGEERDLIIFDLTNSSSTKLTDNRVSGGDNEKLLNVALSRAESKFIFICNVAEVKNSHSSSSVIKRFINWCEKRSFPVVDTETILVNEVYRAQRELSSQIQLPHLLHHANEKDFYEKFIHDISTAQQEIVIESPYITRNRSRQLLPSLEIALHRGVRVYIVTKSADDQDERMKEESTEMIKEFENIGAVVLPFKGPHHLIHRKMSIIDRRISWLGSLNILSWRNSEEVMLRIEGEATYKYLLSLIDFEKNVGSMSEETKLIRCEFCDAPGSWYWTELNKYGKSTICLTGNHKQGEMPTVKATSDGKAHNGLPGGKPLCPEHNIEMTLKNGKYGVFWGCPEYPHCEITFNT